MAYGLCDVPQCEGQTHMDWRQKTEKTGRQICENHWNGYKARTFDLYCAFRFQKPLTMTKTVKIKNYCSCGSERQPGRIYCSTCIADRKRQQKRQYYHRKKNEPEQTEIKILICKSEGCENEREPNHSYCPGCAEWRSRKSHQKSQQNYYRRKQLVCSG